MLDYSSNSKPVGLEIKLIRAEEKDKLSLLLKLLTCIQEGLTLVFCNHREAVERISFLLNENGIFHDTYHGGYEQAQRERALIKFRNGSTPVLVTTDLASRGLDISGVNNIIHYQQASSETVFVHRMVVLQGWKMKERSGFCSHRKKKSRIMYQNILPRLLSLKQITAQNSPTSQRSTSEQGKKIKSAK